MVAWRSGRARWLDGYETWILRLKMAENDRSRPRRPRGLRSDGAQRRSPAGEMLGQERAEASADQWRRSRLDQVRRSQQSFAHEAERQRRAHGANGSHSERD